MTFSVIYDPNEQKIPIKVWASDLDENTRQQASHLAQLPFAVKHVALMADAHLGYGMPIGGVLATANYVVPNAVGVDIGCGMVSRRTNIPADLMVPLLPKLMASIARGVPAGNGRDGERKSGDTLPQSVMDALHDIEARHLDNRQSLQPLVSKLGGSSRQLGTLGGGNHFIEIQADEEGFAWAMLHSGSRALGHAVCGHFDKIARENNARWHSLVPAQHDLAYLPTDSKEGQDYLAWMRLCMEWAAENRRRMIEVAVDQMFHFARGVAPDQEFTETFAVDTHHNYAILENHFGQNVLVHRKGAVRAREGEMVIIPGSMETGSYIGRGKGFAESFTSAPHGAGRRLSRTAAKKEREAADVLKALGVLGIHLQKSNIGDCAEEAGHAYKDVNRVMADSSDMVDPVYRLRPLAVLKG